MRGPVHSPCSVGLALNVGVTAEHTHLSVGQGDTHGSLPSRVHLKRGQGRGVGWGGEEGLNIDSGLEH